MTLMRFRAAVVIGVTTVLACAQPGNKEKASVVDPLTSTLDTVSNVPEITVAQTPAPIPDPAEQRLKIRVIPLDGATGEEFQPFKKLYDEQNAAQGVRYTLYQDGAFDAEDSAKFTPQIEAAYQAILRYSEELKRGITIDKVKATNRLHSLFADDESHNYLPASHSTTLNNVDFMLLGAGSFIGEDDELYKDPDGNPEVHYITDGPVNCLYFFNYLYSRHPGPIETSYGPPLESYYGPPIEIKGIGSITHHLKNRIPVSFLTTIGVVPASLISVRMKLGNSYGCTSAFPEYTFACSKNLNRMSIIGIFYADSPIASEKAYLDQLPGSPACSFDIDGDMQPDIVRVESLEAGSSSDSLAVAVWYARIDDTWVIVEFAHDPDCT